MAIRLRCGKLRIADCFKKQIESNSWAKSWPNQARAILPILFAVNAKLTAW
ncbi:hypothetical protein [Methylobacter sp.]|uniref:hypothetical protein n=1 Tax=Methylobacter sp. TaxID=2051955 RepID=UPI002636D648|nr:hypothetical protein [Methylobacter sp.]